MNRPGIPVSWPVLSATGPLLISRTRVVGELASWAVQQSPYTVPDKLAEAVGAFYDHWPRDEYATFDTIQELERTVRGIMELVPEILAWNQRKNGRDGPGFVTRYSEPHPDDDFIDLDALARNVAMAAWHAAADDKAFDDHLAPADGEVDYGGPKPPEMES